MIAAAPSPWFAPVRMRERAWEALQKPTASRGGSLGKTYQSMPSAAPLLSLRSPHDAAKPDMAGGCVNRFSVARGGTGTAAVIRGAEMRAAPALHAGKFDIRLG